MEQAKPLSKFIYILPVLWAIVLRCSIGLFPHSGQNKPTMFGDFEAQRHWMEITLNLPIREWYFNSTSNDLNYWGLDYPPLTAFHSHILGKITEMVNSNWTSLHVSRGSEDSRLAALMRFFVLLTDISIYLPAISYYYFVTIPKLYKKIVGLDLILCGLFSPAIILIDYGHFQYNTASLGLFIVSSIFLITDKDILGSIFFCLALCYKQMELYHSLPIFCLLLGKCCRSPHFLQSLAKIAATVIITFSVIFVPFIVASWDFTAVSQIFHRLFPVARGIFEDKVSNFWCAISVFVKFKSVAASTIFIICAIATLASSLPACLCVFMNPRKKLRFLYASFIVSLSFFLFSYQVHEKSILIPSVSALLLVPFEPFWANFFLYVATLSMWPLLVKDGLVLGAIATSGIFLLFFAKTFSQSKKTEKIAFVVFNVGYLVIIALSLAIRPPEKYPFLYPLLISQWCCLALLAHFVYFYWRMLTRND